MNDLDLQSLGHAAAMYQRSPRELLVALSTAAPALRLNGVAYYRADQIEDAVAWLVKHDAQQVTEAIHG